MREPAMPAKDAAKNKDCPKCEGAASLLSPLKLTDESMAVYGCMACGHTFRSDGGAYLDNAAELRDYFRGATLGQKTLIESLGGEKLNPASKAVLTAMILEYGTQMWFDGLKQGLLLGTVQAEKGT